MRATVIPYIGHHTDQYLQGCGQFYGQGMYFGLSSAFEVFLIFLLPNYMHVYAVIMQQSSYLTRGEYCNRDTPNFKYSPFLTSSE